MVNARDSKFTGISCKTMGEGSKRPEDEIRAENHRRWYVLNKKAYSLFSAKLTIFDTTEVAHSPLARYLVSKIVKNLRGVKQNETT